jgi:hypothetical protein
MHALNYVETKKLLMAIVFLTHYQMFSFKKNCSKVFILLTWGCCKIGPFFSHDQTLKVPFMFPPLHNENQLMAHH